MCAGAGRAPRFGAATSTARGATPFVGASPLTARRRPHRNATLTRTPCPSQIELHVGAVLGRGSLGTVVRGDFHGSDVAVKVVQYARDKAKDVDAFAMEVAMMSKLHQCVEPASPPHSAPPLALLSCAPPSSPSSPSPRTPPAPALLSIPPTLASPSPTAPRTARTSS